MLTCAPGIGWPAGSGHRANDAAGGDLRVDLERTRDRRENHQHECRRRASHRDHTHGCLPGCRAAHEEPRRPPEPGCGNRTAEGSSRVDGTPESDTGPMLAPRLAPRHSARWRTCGANAMAGAGRLSSATHDGCGAALQGGCSAGLKPCPTCVRSRSTPCPTCVLSAGLKPCPTCGCHAHARLPTPDVALRPWRSSMPRRATGVCLPYTSRPRHPKDGSH